MEPENLARSNGKVIRRIVICFAVITIGMIGMFSLASLRKPPAEVTRQERALQVEGLRIHREDVPVLITGYGEVKALDVVSIAPEVSGKIVAIHPRLEVGEIIHRDEGLFEIDPRDYRAARDSANATVRQWESTIDRLNKQYAIDRERLKTIERNRDLAWAEFERVRQLFEKDSVGTRSGVDAAERAANNAADLARQLEEAVLLYPIQIREAESSLAAAKAAQATAVANLERCAVKAPFDGRVKHVSLEKGQYVVPGQSVLTLANDAILEIEVPLDSRDARQWLRFRKGGSNGETAWFNDLEPVICTIRWTEDREDHVWHGQLNRVVKFDQQTRTLTVAVRIEAQEALSDDPERLPLVEGMFCSVKIPGRTMRGVFRLPRWAVSFENTVYVSDEDRLKTVPVDVARGQGEEAFVSGGLKDGDIVIVTRLIDPLENSLLEVTFASDQDEEGVS
jgi:RND family efflux transporter MFP subunit